jgi:hypothetical protein
MFNEDTLFYLASSLVLARLSIEALVENRNDLSSLCAVGKTITQLERFEKIAQELAATELTSDYAKARLDQGFTTWRALKSAYTADTLDNITNALLFLSATTGAGTFAINTIEAKITSLNNAAANDVISYAKAIFAEAAEEVSKAGVAYFLR